MSATKSAYRSAAGEAAIMAWYDAALKALSVPYESRMVSTRFGDTHLLAAGPPDAPPIVLLHPLAMNAAMWRPQLVALAERYRVYAMDIAGQPGKSAPVGIALSDAGYAEWLLDVLDALAIEEASLVGCSFGGWLILNLSTLPKGQARIAKAVLLSPYRCVSMSARGWRAFLTMAIHLPFPSRKVAARFLQLMRSTNLALEDEFVEFSYLVLKYWKPAATISPLPLSVDGLARLTAPTLLLVGEQDVLFRPQAVVAKAQRCLPNLLAAEIIPNAGHILSQDQPDIVNARLLAFP